MKRFWVGIGFVVLIANLSAQTASEASAKELLAAMDMKGRMEAAKPQYHEMIRQVILQSLQGVVLTADQQRQVDQLTTKVTMSFDRAFTWDRLEPKFERIYRESFTDDEVKQLIAFYQTPLGQIVLHRMPTVMQKAVAEYQGILGPLMREVQTEVQSSIGEIQRPPAK